MNLTRTFDSTSEVVSLSDVKNQLRITTTADDDSLRLFIAACRRYVEHFLGKTLVTSTWEWKVDCFSSCMVMPMGPVQSITSIQYVDANGDTQTLSSSNYQFDKRGRLKPAYGLSWPSTRSQFDAVTVTYVAGETHAGNVPEDIKHALLLLVGSADVGRENTVIGAGVVVSELPEWFSAQALLAPHKEWRL